MEKAMLRQIVTEVTSEVMKTQFDEMLIVKDTKDEALIKIPVIWYERFAEELIKRLKK